MGKKCKGFKRNREDLLVSIGCLNIEKARCTGCGMCQNVCPAAAISMFSDQEGFWYPFIDEEKCIACGKCAKMCPVAQKIAPAGRDERPVEIYAAWSLDEEIRFSSTSGGMSSEFALSVLKDGGVVCGAVYDRWDRVRHMIVEDRNGLKRIRQSKYVQSDMGDTYKEIGERLLQGKSLLFCGTPCQCQAVSQYCRGNGIDTTRLYLTDFICRGSNSPKVYQRFLEGLETEYGSAVSRVWFKDKTYGWNRFSTRIEFENGACYLKDRYHDPFIRGYIEENLYIRPSCSACSFKGFHRVADITLGDFWGVQLKEGGIKSDGGISMVMVHTEKGRKLWDSIQDRIRYEGKSLEEMIKGNACFMYSVKPGEHRERFMKDLDRMPVIENIERFLKDV